MIVQHLVLFQILQALLSDGRKKPVYLSAGARARGQQLLLLTERADGASARRCQNDPLCEEFGGCIQHRGRRTPALGYEAASNRSGYEGACTALARRATRHGAQALARLPKRLPGVTQEDD